MSNAVIKEIYIPKGRHNRPGRTRKARGLLYHTTNNWSKGADAEAHANFLRNTNNYTSWHVTVDHDSAVQHLPFGESAYHAGDGGHGQYNTYWIGMEICTNRVSQNDKLDKETYNHAVQTAAYIMQKNGLSKKEQLKPHNVVYGKNCPWNKHFDYEQFENDVLKALGKPVKAPSYKPKPVTSGLLRYGDKGKAVKEAQELLIAAGYNIGIMGADGIFGKRTTNAVLSFQRAHKIGVDGIIGPETMSKLKQYAKYKKYPGKLIRKGSRGHYVKVVQARVGAKVDGIFGPETERKVRAFQQMQGVGVDGIVGPVTWKEIFE